MSDWTAVGNPAAALGRTSFSTVLRTNAWRTDESLKLEFPENWDVTTLWPAPPPALTEEQMAEKLDRPFGQHPIAEMCRRKSRPLVIIDDLNRPTPAGVVVSLLLKRFREAGIPAGNVKILVATGTHGPPTLDSLRQKVGAEAASACEILVHDSKRNCVHLGSTASGLPVFVDKAVVKSDFIIGIGGVYPNYTAGFGGGSKLALGVLGFRSIKTLHFRYHGVGWGETRNRELRTELDEIARMIRLETMISVQINADREIVRLSCGDHFSYYDDEIGFARRYFGSPPPTGADIVIANAYPSDLSLTAVLQKATNPLQHASPGASRVLIASCAEGVGKHGLFPVIRPRYLPAVQFARRLFAMKPRQFAQAIGRRMRAHPRPGKSPETRLPIWFYQPLDRAGTLPSNIPGFRLAHSWPEIVQGIEKEQGHRKSLKAVVYPCSPLQCLNR
jgi:nickel-dependent lactate racemase